MARISAASTIGFDMFETAIGSYLRSTLTSSAATAFELEFPGGYRDVIEGSGFTFSADGQLLSGVVTKVTEYRNGDLLFVADDLSLQATQLMGWLAENDFTAFFSNVLSGADDILGSRFDDRIYGYGGDDRIDAGAGDDEIDGGLGNDTIEGGAGNDQIYGDLGDDTLIGGLDDDLLHGGAGADVLDGGAGNDTADYSGNFGAVVVNLAAGAGAWNYAEGDRLIDIENVNGTEWGDWLTGDWKANKLVGNGGDDMLHGGAGADLLDGGEGIDTADYAGDFGAVIVDLAAGTGSWNFAEGDRYISIENVIGTSWNDSIAGDDGANLLAGGAGNDVLNGRGGDDVLVGGAGADVLIGGAGIDTIDYSSTIGAVWVNLAVGQGFWNDAEGDRISEVENVIGTRWNDFIVGDARDNVLSGGAGDDIIDGGGGADLIDGGAGSDTIDFSGNFGGVWINLQAGQGSWNSAEGDRYTSIENVRGTAFNDIIEGDTNNNVLTGGGGNDLFTFRKGFGNDTVTDFSGNGAAVGDRIQFAGLFSGFDDMMAHATQQGRDVVIKLDASNTLTLANISLYALHSEDFLY